MTDLPIRERILQALATNIGAHRSLENVDVRDLPMRVLNDGEETAIEQYGMVSVTMPITVAFADTVPGNKSDEWHELANIALAELIRDVQADEDLDGLVQGIDYTGGGVAAISDGATGYQVNASFNVRYAFVHGDPFSNEEV